MMFLKNALRFLALASLLALVAGCGGDTYDSYVYPDKLELDDPIALGQFPSLQACREASLAKLKELNAESTGDYVCGQNCHDHACQSAQK
ncbi:hypothetical protein [Methylovorus sp. MP688]|uniref:hypothetical protein n=1 Tax=Methylovorus sp. (strain MP688) TaxID=887061 RepID=UPI0001EC4D6C|nr:hypothetical protein [Methylovorus sp. MP688]ADQ85197.1 conserved hypothetical protein [Methylovorus sp. MP688]